MDCKTKESITRLRQLRDNLCDKQSEWKKAFAVKDIIVCELKKIKESVIDPNVGRDQLLNEIDTLLILIDPDRQKEMEDHNVG